MSGPIGPVTLREVTRDNVDALLGLAVMPAQQRYIATTAQTLAQAAYRPEVSVQAICAGERPVGLLALRADPRGTVLWRMLVDARFQRCGIGRAAVELVAQATEGDLYVRVVPDEAGPLGFWRRLGFAPTGADDELVELRWAR